MSQSTFQTLAQALSGTPPNLTEPEIIQLIDLLHRRQALITVQSQSTVTTPQTYIITVDHDQTVEQMIAQMIGQDDYYLSASITTDHFPLLKTGMAKVTINLLTFNPHPGDRDFWISSENALRKMTKLGFRPATLAELLTLGTTYPETLKMKIVALGSIWNDALDRPNVPVSGGMKQVFLGLDFYDNGWNAECRFAAVRK